MLNYILWNNQSKKEQSAIGISHISQLYPAPTDCVWVAIKEDISTSTLEVDASGNLVEIARQPDLLSLQAAATTKFTNLRDMYLTYAITDLGVFNTDDTSMVMINATVNSINAGLITEQVSWKMYDNTIKTFAAGDFVKAAHDIINYKSNIMQISWTIKTQIQAATAADQISALAWPTSANSSSTTTTSEATPNAS